MASSLILPQPGQIVTWSTPEQDERANSSASRGFKETILDKSIFYRHSAAQWDQASDKSYQLQDDIATIDAHAADIANLISANSTVLEYGPGASGKVLPITNRMHRTCSYIAVDMHRPFLRQTIEKVSGQSAGRIKASGIETDFQGFPEIISKVDGPKFIVSFGSNLFNHPDPIEQLRPIAENMSRGDKIYLSIDCHGIHESEKIKDTYNCPEFLQFIQSTLEKLEGYDGDQWALESRLHEGATCHHSFHLTAKEEVLMGDELYKYDDVIEFFPCYKSSKEAVEDVCSQLGLAVEPVFESDSTKMSKYLDWSPTFHVPS